MEEERIEQFYQWLLDEKRKVETDSSRYQNSWYRRGYIDSIRRIVIMTEIAFKEELR